MERLVGRDHDVLVGVHLLVILADGAGLCFVIVVVAHALLVVAVLRTLAATRVRSWALILLVEAATTLNATAPWLLTIALSVVTSVFAATIAIVFATRNDGLHGLLFGVKEMIEDVHQFDLFFFLELVELLDLFGHGVTLSLVPHLLQGVKVMLGVGKQATEGDSATAKTKERRNNESVFAIRQSMLFERKLTDGNVMSGSDRGKCRAESTGA